MCPIQPDQRPFVDGHHLFAKQMMGADLEQVAKALKDPANYKPLSFAAPPTTEDLQSGGVRLIEDGEPTSYRVRVIGLWLKDSKGRVPGSPAGNDLWGFCLEYGWESAFDRTREVDLVAILASQRSFGLFLEGLMLVALFVFGQDWGDRMRWRARSSRQRPPLCYQRVKARHISTSACPPDELVELGRRQYAHLFELHKRELYARIREVGLNHEKPLGTEINLPWGRQGK